MKSYFLFKFTEVNPFRLYLEIVDLKQVLMRTNVEKFLWGVKEIFQK